MKEIELVRTVQETENLTSLMIFKVLVDCNLSSVSLTFRKGDIYKEIKLPNVDVKAGDFVWLCDMQDENLFSLTEESNENTSSTKTIVVVVKIPELTLDDLEYDS